MPSQKFEEETLLEQKELRLQFWSFSSKELKEVGCNCQSCCGLKQRRVATYFVGSLIFANWLVLEWAAEQPQCANVTAHWLLLVGQASANGKFNWAVESPWNCKTVISWSSRCLRAFPFQFHFVILLTRTLKQTKLVDLKGSRPQNSLQLTLISIIGIIVNVLANGPVYGSKTKVWRILQTDVPARFNWIVIGKWCVHQQLRNWSNRCSDPMFHLKYF